MRVLFCIPSLSGGGAESQLRTLVKGLKNEGVGITVLYHYEGPCSDGFLLERGVSFVKIPYGHNDIRSLVFIFRFLKRNEFNVVQTWIKQMDVLVGLSLLILGKAGKVWVIREPNSDYSIDGVSELVRRCLGVFSSAVVSNSKVGLNIWNSKKGRMIRNGYNFNLIRRQSSKNKEGIIFVGRLVDQKNVRLVADLLKYVAFLRRDINISFYGDGPLRHWLEDYFHGVGNVNLCGYSKDIYNVMADSKMLVSLSKHEGSPNVVVESMIAGLKLVLSNITSHAEIFSGHEVFDLLFVDIDNSIYDRDNVAKRLLCLYDSEYYGWDKVLVNYDESVLVADYMKLYSLY